MSIFNFYLWKKNCFEMYEKGTGIYRFLNNYIFDIEEIFRKIGEYDDKKYRSEDYYNYLIIFYWYKSLKEKFEHKHGFDNFFYNLSDFNALYYDNLDAYNSISLEHKRGLEHDELTSKFTYMFYDYKTNEENKFKGILAKIIDFRVIIKEIIDDLDETIFKLNKEEPLSFDQFTLEKNNPIEINFTPSGLIKNTSLLKMIKDAYAHVDDFKLRFELLDYFRNLTNEFDIFINEELVRIVKNNLFMKD